MCVDLQDGMRSSGPLGSHMAARPHLAPALPTLQSGNATAAHNRLAADSRAKDDGHLVALSPSARPALPRAEAAAAGNGRRTAQVAPAPQGVAHYAGHHSKLSLGSIPCHTKSHRFASLPWCAARISRGRGASAEEPSCAPFLHDTC